VQFETVAAAVEGVPEPHIPVAQGRVIYDHVRETRPASVLELGTAHGVSAAFIAAALDANGEGHLTTVDSSQITWANPTPGELLEAAGLRGRVSIDRSYSTYNWFLKEQVEAQSDDAGNCEPLYDFCFLDGQKNWSVDGLAVVLVQKLLRPGGWLLLDDLGWTYSPATTGFHYWTNIGELSERERTEPHMRAVFELIVKQDPAYTEFRIQDEWWGWARKGSGEPRRLTIDTTRSLRSYVLAGMRLMHRRFEIRFARRR
jgi:predicted O-methyltransferase YrrM